MDHILNVSDAFQSNSINFSIPSEYFSSKIYIPSKRSFRTDVCSVILTDESWSFLLVNYSFDIVFEIHFR